MHTVRIAGGGLVHFQAFWTQTVTSSCKGMETFLEAHVYIEHLLDTHYAKTTELILNIRKLNFIYYSFITNCDMTALLMILSFYQLKASYIKHHIKTDEQRH